MRSPGVYRLKFLLPPGARSPAGAHAADSGCSLHVGHAGNVTIEAPSREAAFNLAGRILRECCLQLAPLSIAALLEQPAADRFGRPYHASDSWSIIVGADVAFSPTAMPPHLSVA
jgi:hypothetical protein